jgi:hypothetical protein
MGVGIGAALGCVAGGYLASKMTTTPANKRILYSGIGQIAAGFLLRRRFPSIALGLVASGAVNVVSVAMTATPNALLDGSRFTADALPAPEAGSLRSSGTSTTTSTTTMPYVFAR